MRHLLLLPGLLFCACSEQPEATSLFGTELFPPPLSADARTEREAKLATAKAAFANNPEDIDAIIWLGRRTAYLGHYREAITIYTRGLELHPDEPRLLRHRGHRYITVRRCPAAIRDLERAAELVKGTPDRVEPDGLPNARNTPTGTLQSSIWYHLGLARYLLFKYEEAAAAYAECMEVSGNPDMLCATSHWYFMTLRHLGRTTEAAQLLPPIHADLDVIENHGYHRLLLMYKGELKPEDLLGSGGDQDGIQSATVGYGVANWLLLEGRDEEGEALLQKIVEGEQWPAFGYLAAEVELTGR